MRYSIKFLSIYRWQADYQVIDLESGKTYRIRVEEPEGKAVSSYPKAPPEAIAAAIEYRNARGRAGFF